MNINDLSEEMISHYFPLLTQARKEKILNMEDNTQRSIAFCSEILARKCLSKLCDAPEFSFSLLCNPNSKSAVGNFDAELSISQKDDFVACAVSFDYIGIGVAKIEAFSFKEAQDKLTDVEIRSVFSDSGYSFSDIIRKSICTEESVMVKFAVYKSLKEAQFFASGRAIRSNSKSISFEYNENGMICSDENYVVEKSYIDINEKFAVSIVKRCK